MERGPVKTAGQTELDPIETIGRTAPARKMNRALTCIAVERNGTIRYGCRYGG